MGARRTRWRFRPASSGTEGVPARQRALDPRRDIESVRPTPAAPLEAELGPSFPEVPLQLLAESRWHPLWFAPFVHAEPIHLKEARAALAAIKRRTRDATRHGGTEVLFGDNVAVILAFPKGRATLHPLNRILQRACAELLASGIRCHHRWVASELNVADGPSRLREKGGRLHGCTPMHRGQPWALSPGAWRSPARRLRRLPRRGGKCQGACSLERASRSRGRP